MLKRLLPLAALLILACGGGEVSEPAPEPAPAQAEPEIDPAGMVADDPGSHCEGEKLFHCEVEDGKYAAVCNEDGWMVYRFGALGDLEAEFPAPDMPTDWGLKQVPGGQTLSFTLHDNSVLLTEQKDFTGVSISAPDDSIVATYTCQGEVTSNWKKLAEVMPQ